VIHNGEIKGDSDNCTCVVCNFDSAALDFVLEWTTRVFLSFGGFAMRKSLLILLAVGMVIAISSPVFATVSFTNALGDGDFANFSNWSGPPTNSWGTETADFRAPATLTGGILNWDVWQNKGGTLDMSGGELFFKNYTSTNGIALFRGATVNISGGKLIGEQVNIGDDQWDFDIADNPAGDGVNIVNISGTGIVRIQPNDFPDPNSFIYQAVAFRIWPNGSKVTIADSGLLKVYGSLQADVDAYMADGRIVAANPGDTLAATMVGDYYVVSVVPEPGTLLLLCLGLGSLALIRRK
jgi:hypothetical protein